jgi:hypothetical protein
MKTRLLLHKTLLAGCMLVLLLPHIVYALSPEQRDVIGSGAQYFNVEVPEVGGACTLPGGNNAEKVWNFFIGKGYIAEQVAGILGNMQTESGIEPMRSQGKGIDEKISSEQVATGSWPGGPAWGIVQWDPPSKMIDPSRAAGASFSEIDSIEYQVQYLWEQLEGQGVGGESTNEKAAGDHLKQQTTVDGAARSFMTKFERPKDQSESAQQDRVALAQNWFNEFSSSTGGGGASCQGGTYTPITYSSREELEGMVLNHPNINFGNYGPANLQRSDVQDPSKTTESLLVIMFAMADQGAVVVPVNAINSDHDPGTHHSQGRAIDIGYYGSICSATGSGCNGSNNADGNTLYKFLYDNKDVLLIDDLIWGYPPDGYDCINEGVVGDCDTIFGESTIYDHRHHIHVSVREG